MSHSAPCHLVSEAAAGDPRLHRERQCGTLSDLEMQRRSPRTRFGGRQGFGMALRLIGGQLPFLQRLTACGSSLSDREAGLHHQGVMRQRRADPG